MLSREYALFIGFLLLVMGIAGYMAPQFLGATNMTAWTPTIWVITALVALAVGFGVRSVSSLRWFAGIAGIVYMLWGVVALFSAPVAPTINLRDLLSVIMVGVGSLGLAAALAPAYWMRERETYAPGHA